MPPMRINVRKCLFVVAGMAVGLAAGCNSGAEVPSGSDPVEEAAVANESSNGATPVEEPPQPSTDAVLIPDANPPAVEPAQDVPLVSSETPVPPVTSADLPLGNGNDEAAAERLEARLAEVQIPPDWLAEVNTRWDTSKPWKEARLEIRRLLGTEIENDRREAIKLTWLYLQKDDINDGHEYSMYLFLGKEPLWAIIAFRELLARESHAYPPYFAITSLASLYTEHGLFTEAEKLLERGLASAPPDKRWVVMRQAEMHDALGDLYIAWGRRDDARASYGKAISLFQQANPPYGQHLLPRRAKKVQSKLDLLSARALSEVTLRDGAYRETALGYSGDIHLTVRVRGGRIDAIDVKHEEKIDQNACKLVPAQIVEQQSLQVDAISGATVTQQAIIGGTLDALKQAGLK